MNKRQKEALIIALAEKGATYREITAQAGVSPNAIKAVLNKADLDLRLLVKQVYVILIHFSSR